jgi:Ca2+-binding RTX toxin-like protein
MRRAILVVTAAASMAGTADAAAPVRGAASCWDVDLAGTDASERLEGTAAAEHLAAYAGDDETLLFGGDDCAAGGLGNDAVHLGPGDDEAAGGAGADHLYGGPGDDALLPGLGADRADGGDGDDLLRDERGDGGRDVLAGGDGHDVLRAANAGADRVECGPGHDLAFVDAADDALGCEQVVVARRPALAARTLRTGVRPAFALRWESGGLPPGGRVEVRLVGRPVRGPRCDVGAWRAAGRRLSWRGRRAACPGDYAFAVTHVAGRAAGPPVPCERLAGAPASGCAPAERLGVIALAVR